MSRAPDTFIGALEDFIKAMEGLDATRLGEIAFNGYQAEVRTRQELKRIPGFRAPTWKEMVTDPRQYGQAVESWTQAGRAMQSEVVRLVRLHMTRLGDPERLDATPWGFAIGGPLRDGMVVKDTKPGGVIDV